MKEVIIGGIKWDSSQSAESVRVVGDLDLLLSEFGNEFYKILAIFSKIFDENDKITDVWLKYKIIDKELLICITMVTLDNNEDIIVDLNKIFIKNGLLYETNF